MKALGFMASNLGTTSAFIFKYTMILILQSMILNTKIIIIPLLFGHVVEKEISIDENTCENHLVIKIVALNQRKAKMVPFKLLNFHFFCCHITDLLAKN